MKREGAVCALLVLATLWAYQAVRHHPFLALDDPSFVSDNPRVLEGVTARGLGWALNSTETGNWQPLTWFSHMLDVELFGRDPAGHHLTSVLLHVVNALLVFSFFRLATGSVLRSGFVAALFALHPLRVESVAWISERKDVLSLCLGLLALLAYRAYAAGPDGGRGRRAVCYGLTVVCLALALAAKPMMVTLPFVMLLLDYWPLARVLRSGPIEGTPPIGRDWARLVVEKAPLFALVACSCVVTYNAQHGAGAMGAAGMLSWPARAANATVSYWRYLAKTVWPADLVMFYPHPTLEGRPWSAATVLIAGLLLVGVSTAAVLARRRCPYLIVGWLWYAGMLVPVLGLVQVGGQSMADRYTYAPLIGVFAIAAWGGVDVARGWRVPVPVATALAVSLLAACLVLTRKQVGFWRDDEALARHALASSDRNGFAYDMLGSALRERGRLDEAMDAYSRAIEIRPGWAEAQNNLGLALFELGRSEEAMRAFERALELAPRLDKAHNNLGLVLFGLGRIDEAIREYRRALELAPDSKRAHGNLASALTARGQFDEALVHFRRALEIDPGFFDARNNLAAGLARQGRLEEAISEFEAAVRLRPESPEAQFNMAVALASKGDRAGAVRHLHEALRLRPVFPQALELLSQLEPPAQ